MTLVFGFIFLFELVWAAIVLVGIFRTEIVLYEQKIWIIGIIVILVAVFIITRIIPKQIKYLSIEYIARYSLTLKENGFSFSSNSMKGPIVSEINWCIFKGCRIERMGGITFVKFYYRNESTSFGILLSKKQKQEILSQISNGHKDYLDKIEAKEA